MTKLLSTLRSQSERIDFSHVLFVLLQTIPIPSLHVAHVLFPLKCFTVKGISAHLLSTAHSIC